MKENIVFLDVVDSTNTYAKTHFHELPDCTLVVAREQTAGRGRLSRRWVSPPDVNFYGSAVLKRCPDPFAASQALSLAALEVLNRHAPELQVYIKWPNDLYCGSAKLAGMLCESVTDDHNRLLGVVAGLGVNLNMSPADLAAIDQEAVSVLSLTSRPFSPIFFARELAFSLLANYIIYSKDFAALFPRWRAANRLIGKEIEVADHRGARRGVFVDVSPAGEMMFREQGSEKTEKLNSGDVRIIKKSWEGACNAPDNNS